MGGMGAWGCCRVEGWRGGGSRAGGGGLWWVLLIRRRAFSELADRHCNAARRRRRSEGVPRQNVPTGGRVSPAEGQSCVGGGEGCSAAHNRPAAALPRPALMPPPPPRNGRGGGCCNDGGAGGTVASTPNAIAEGVWCGGGVRVRPLKPRRGGAQVTDSGSTFRAGVHRQTRGQGGVGVCCPETVRGPQTPGLLVVVHLQPFGNATYVRCFGTISSPLGLHATDEQWCSRDVQYPRGLRAWVSYARLLNRLFCRHCPKSTGQCFGLIQANRVPETGG